MPCQGAPGGNHRVALSRLREGKVQGHGHCDPAPALDHRHAGFAWRSTANATRFADPQASRGRRLP